VVNTENAPRCVRPFVVNAENASRCVRPFVVNAETRPAAFRRSSRTAERVETFRRIQMD
jgi:hypothetical protein